MSRWGVRGTSGRLGKGMDADLLVLDGDPLNDLRLLSRVGAVWREGRMIVRAEHD